MSDYKPQTIADALNTTMAKFDKQYADAVEMVAHLTEVRRQANSILLLIVQNVIVENGYHCAREHKRCPVDDQCGYCQAVAFLKKQGVKV